MGIAWLALGRRNCKCSVFQPTKCGADSGFLACDLAWHNSELTAIHS